jgi:glycyl-tRNA synthetase beta subunit
MVMVDDAALKQARLELLTTLRHAIVSNIGDLSQIGTA